MTHVAQYVMTHGALLLFAWILAQQAGAPIPSMPLLLIVGSLAGSGGVNVASVLGASFGACLARMDSGTTLDAPAGQYRITLAREAAVGQPVHSASSTGIRLAR